MTENDRMSRGGNLALCVVVGALLSACATPYSEAPIATNFPTTKQPKLQAGSHWNAIAADAAESISNALRAGKGCIAPAAACNLIFVKEPKVATQFSRAFKNQFVTTLVNRGVNVAKGPTAGAIEIDFDIQTVKFTNNRPDGTFYSATAIAGGLWALHGTWEHTSPGASVALATLAFDVNRWMTSDLATGPTPAHEVFVTVTASGADRLLGRVTNVYYTADTDIPLYVPRPNYVRTVPVKGGE